uniref:Hemagglutinin n=1 Tax=Lepidopteran orthomyxo-related virus OKIAV178 TaxID=2746278 RepID=A0A7D7J4D8_9ORTO|nr:hemagglutinin [Lepidopteran orthomyxo-related virus OKIAV178]
MPTTFNVTLLTLIILGVTGNIQPPCDMKNCVGYNKLKSHMVKKPNIEMTKTTIKITEGKSDINILYAKRKWLTIFCYDGTSIDPNTGCYETVTNKNPNCNTLREWMKKDLCPTGYECRPDGECVAGTAWEKCFDSTTMIRNKGPHTLKWEGTRFLRFPVHTCTSSWECNAFRATVPTFTTIRSSGDYTWSFYDKDNREHLIGSDVFSNGIESPTGEILCMEDEPKDPSVYIGAANCFSEDLNNIKCMIMDEGKYKGTVIDLNTSGEGTIRNLAIEVIGPLLVPAEGKIIDINENKHHGSAHKTTTLLDRQRAVNIETAHELAVGANLLQLQTLYNILSLSQEIDLIYNILLKVIKSQSINDPLLISRILGIKDFASKWVNEEVFERCSCISESFPTNSNCGDGKRYNYGSFIPVNDTSTCFHISQEDIEEISFINKPNLTTQSIKYLSPQAATSDSAPWDALNNYRNELENSGRKDHGYENLQERLTSLEESIIGYPIKSIFIYVTNGISWITFLLVIMMCCRR